MSDVIIAYSSNDRTICRMSSNISICGDISRSSSSAGVSNSFTVSKISVVHIRALAVIFSKNILQTLEN